VLLRVIRVEIIQTLQGTNKNNNKSTYNTNYDKFKVIFLFIIEIMSTYNKNSKCNRYIGIMKRKFKQR